MTPAVAIETGHFTHSGYRFAYERLGECTAPPILLLHGILLDAHVNRDLAQRMAGEGFQVILLDLLGHGRSDVSTDPKDHRADFYADQVLAALDHLGFAQAIVGGVSLGCIVTLHAAAKAPERIRAMFLEMPVMEWSAPWAALILSPALLSSRLLPFLHRPFARLMRRLPRPRTAWLCSVLNTLSMDPAVVAAILHGVLVGAIVPTEAVRRGLHMPALIIGHGGDRLHELRDAQVLHAELPQSHLLQARHLLELRTNPGRLWPEISAFLAPLRAPATRGRRSRTASRTAARRARA